MHLRKGFTLIELLVVIAIIAILAAILFPVFAKAREKARQSSCASNEKQMGLAVMSYKQDYDETFPMNYTAGAGGTVLVCSAPAFWFIDELKPYVKNNQIWICPSGPGYNCNATPIDPIANPVTPHGYGYSTAASGAKDSDVPVPAATHLIADADNQSCIPQCCTLITGPIIADRHSEQFNVLFCDGHVKSSKDSVPNQTANRMWTLADD
jgi:prepilin-type N-terminal cleavage/methylation domain-containing protein/prepilin-type processing-associated H-X9-DG protein